MIGSRSPVKGPGEGGKGCEIEPLFLREEGEYGAGEWSR